MRPSRRKIKRTCPVCGHRLSRITSAAGLFRALRFVSRLCLSCGYSDYHGWELEPTSEDTAVDMARMTGERSIRLYQDPQPFEPRVHALMTLEQR